jgi:magnesium and cobalt transporter
MEEIVGDMMEEGDEVSEEWIVEEGSGVYTVDPRLSIDEFMEEFGIDIPEGDYDSIGGFITSRLERIPHPGESMEFGSVVFEVADSDKKRISKLVVRMPQRKES